VSSDGKYGIVAAGSYRDVGRFVRGEEALEEKEMPGVK
jgi:hypothetical protein